jgi:hypothetical protein
MEDAMVNELTRPLRAAEMSFDLVSDLCSAQWVQFGWQYPYFFVLRSLLDRYGSRPTLFDCLAQSRTTGRSRLFSKYSFDFLTQTLYTS